MTDSSRARVTLYIKAPPEDVYAAFCDPAKLTAFWLSAASRPLRIAERVHWTFMVEGAETDVTTLTTDPGKKLVWEWGGSRVAIDFEAVDGGTAVTLVNDGFSATGQELFDSLLDATEGFAFVLADLKTLLETGSSAGIVAAKAKLIERSQG
jgi:uncharacterized protein YndB with AHSA1/START domain